MSNEGNSLLPGEPAWKWNELQHLGTDYDDPAEARAYDRRMAAIRDVAAENRAILNALALAPEATVLEIGCGTAAFAREAARVFRTVIAVDVSRVMLDYASDQAKAAGLANIQFYHGGFLTYEHCGDPVDAVVSGLALHHLPDFWKSVALARIAGMLKPDGRLFLMDVVYSFEGPAEVVLEQLVRNHPETTRVAFARHIAQEHSTSDWIMRGLLERAGFAIERAELERGWLARYLCRRQ